MKNYILLIFNIQKKLHVETVYNVKDIFSFFSI